MHYDRMHIDKFDAFTNALTLTTNTNINKLQP